MSAHRRRQAAVDSAAQRDAGHRAHPAACRRCGSRGRRLRASLPKCREARFEFRRSTSTPVRWSTRHQRFGNRGWCSAPAGRLDSALDAGVQESSWRRGSRQRPRRTRRRLSSTTPTAVRQRWLLRRSCRSRAPAAERRCGRRCRSPSRIARRGQQPIQPFPLGPDRGRARQSLRRRRFLARIRGARAQLPGRWRGLYLSGPTTRTDGRERARRCAARATPRPTPQRVHRAIAEPLATGRACASSTGQHRF